MEHCCEAAVITCIDFRFWKSLVNYFDEQGLLKYDLISLGGGAKNVIDDATRELVFRQLDISTKLHQIKKVFLVNHLDCGAYGGSKAFESLELEEEKLVADLHMAKNLISEKYPELEIETLMMDFDGVRSAEKMEEIEMLLNDTSKEEGFGDLEGAVANS